MTKSPGSRDDVGRTRGACRGSAGSSFLSLRPGLVLRVPALVAGARVLRAPVLPALVLPAFALPALVSLSCGLLISARPARGADVSVVGEMTREAGLPPGGRTEGVIRVRNAGSAPADVRIYQTDYRSTADGRNVYGSPGSVGHSNASWIVFTPERLRIAPGEEGSVSYAVQVPPSDSLTGTYWSMLMVEPQPDAAGPLAAGSSPNIGIRTVYRQAVQLVTNVGERGTENLHVLASQVLCDGGKRIFRWDVENDGTSWLRPAVYADIYAEDGHPLGRVEGGRGRIYPGCSVRFDLDMSRLSIGKYTALVIADGGGDRVFGARYGLDLDVDCSGPIAATKPD